MPVRKELLIINHFFITESNNDEALRRHSKQHGLFHDQLVWRSKAAIPYIYIRINRSSSK